MKLVVEVLKCCEVQYRRRRPIGEPFPGTHQEDCCRCGKPLPWDPKFEDLSNDVMEAAQPIISSKPDFRCRVASTEARPVDDTGVRLRNFHTCGAEIFTGYSNFNGHHFDVHFYESREEADPICECPHCGDPLHTGNVRTPHEFIDINLREPAEETHPSGLSGEHDVVLDAIHEEALHGVE